MICLYIYNKIGVKMSLVPKIIQPIKKHPFENNMIVIFKKYKKNNKWI